MRVRQPQTPGLRLESSGPFRGSASLFAPGFSGLLRPHTVFHVRSLAKDKQIKEFHPQFGHCFEVPSTPEFAMAGLSGTLSYRGVNGSSTPANRQVPRNARKTTSKPQTAPQLAARGWAKNKRNQFQTNSQLPSKNQKGTGRLCFLQSASPKKGKPKNLGESLTPRC